MTGKQLKQWAAGIHDDAIIETQERSYSCWVDEFSLRATLQLKWDCQQQGKERGEPVLG